MLPTNPTSGGLPGRQRHVVSASENMQTISTAAYGSPKLWRGVAEANGIDDPFRVQAGRHRVPAERQRDREAAVT